MLKDLGSLLVIFSFALSCSKQVPHSTTQNVIVDNSKARQTFNESFFRFENYRFGVNPNTGEGGLAVGFYSQEIPLSSATLSDYDRKPVLDELGRNLFVLHQAIGSNLNRNLDAYVELAVGESQVESIREENGICLIGLSTKLYLAGADEVVGSASIRLNISRINLTESASFNCSSNSIILTDNAIVIQGTQSLLGQGEISVCSGSFADHCDLIIEKGVDLKGNEITTKINLVLK
jgi:hypothetical protein